MKISIIGAAGSLGSCTAFTLAMQGLADEIVMLDPRENFLHHHASDIGTAVSGRDIIIRAGKDEDLAGSEIIIITAGAPIDVVSSRRESLPHNLPIILEIARKIRRFSPESIVITATSTVEAMNYALYLATGCSRFRLLGYSMNDSIRFRKNAAHALGVPAGSVDGLVIGEHGNSQVMLFSTVTVDNKPVTINETVKSEFKKNISVSLHQHQALKTGLTSGWTSAVGLAVMVSAVKRDSDELIPCSVVLDGEYGCHDVSITVPALIGRKGISRITEIDLADDELNELERSIEIVKKDMLYVESSLKKK